ncbi:MAG TPA: hypothetical protein PLQ81_15125, partial [bacterium]|nr:hypothetical protein [bacterium]
LFLTFVSSNQIFSWSTLYMDNFTDPNADATLNKYTGFDGTTEWFKGRSNYVSSTGWKNYKMNDGGGNWWCRPSSAPNGVINAVNQFNKQGSDYGDYWMDFSVGYYTYITKDPSGTGDILCDVSILLTSAIPISISSVTSPSNVDSGQANTVYCVLSGSKCPEEKVLFVYTTDAWTNRTAIEASVSGTNCSAVIPAQNAGTTVQFYVITTTVSAATYTGYSDDKTRGLMTLFWNNNTGSNYSYQSRAIMQKVEFLTDTSATYSNVSGSSDTLAMDTHARFEIKITPSDLIGTGGFGCTMYYRINSGVWKDTQVNFDNNFGGYGYWRKDLKTGSVINNGDSVTFYFVGYDWNTISVWNDSNSGNYYKFYVEFRRD